MGLDQFSMNPPQVPKIKELINNISFSDTKAIVDGAVKLSTSIEVNRYLQEKIKKVLKGDLYRMLMI